MITGIEGNLTPFPLTPNPSPTQAGRGGICLPSLNSGRGRGWGRIYPFTVNG